MLNDPVNWVDLDGLVTLQAPIPSKDSFNDILNSLGLGGLPDWLNDLLYDIVSDPTVAAGPGVAYKIPNKAIVVGEGMDDVKVAVRALRKQCVNAKWYQAWGRNFKKGNFDLQKSLKRNEHWIKTKMNEGYDIYDIGIDPSRTRRSPFYQLEKDLIEKNNYPTTPIPRP